MPENIWTNLKKLTLNNKDSVGLYFPLNKIYQHTINSTSTSIYLYNEKQEIRA